MMVGIQLNLNENWVQLRDKIMDTGDSNVKGIWRIYSTDWKNVLKVPTGILLMIALALLPSVYNWVNIYSVWDPYSHTGGIKIAVTSLDKGTELNGTAINIGEDLIENLKQNEKLGWTFVDEKTARDGVNSGEYYASLLIPEDFSFKIAEIAQGKVNKPEVLYTVNEKINAVAPKITGSGVSAVTAQINESFVKSVSETVLSKLQELGIEIENNIPTIRKVKAGLFELESSLPEIEKMSQKIIHVAELMPDITAKAQKIVLLEEKLPELEKAGNLIVELQAQWPHIADAAVRMNQLHQKMPEIQALADKAVTITEHAAELDEALTRLIARLERADTFIQSAKEAMPELERLAQSGSALAEGLQQFLQSHEAAFAAFPEIVKQNLVLLQQTSLNATATLQQLLSADIDPQATRDSLINIRGKMATGVQIIDTTVRLLENLNGYLNNEALVSKVSDLKALKSKMNQQIAAIDKIVKLIDNGEKPAKELMTDLLRMSTETNQALGQLLNNYDSEIVPAMNKALEQLIKMTDSSVKLLDKADETLLPGIKELLADAHKATGFALEGVKELQKDLPVIYTEIDKLTAGLQDRVGQFSQAMDKLMPFLNKELPVIEERLDQAADFVRNDLGNLEEQIVKASDFVQHRLPELEDALNRAAELIQQDLPGLEQAVHKAADKLRELDSEQNFVELAQMLKGDIKAESDFLAKPVHIHEERLYAIPNYGSAMTPFYIVLSLWVGATLLISLLRVDVEDSEAYKGYQIYFGRMLFFLTIGFLQALIMALGDIYLLGVYIVDKLWFIIFAALVSNVFVTITYTLLTVFGNIGKGIAIIFMVFQFSSSGGTFPISTTSHFFQVLNPFMPFTYAISILREAVGGIYTPTVLKDAAALLIIIAICYIVGLLLKKPLSGFTRRSQENAKKTKIIS